MKSQAKINSVRKAPQKSRGKNIANMIQTPQTGNALKFGLEVERRDENSINIRSVEDGGINYELHKEKTKVGGDNDISSSKVSIAIPPLFKECLALYKAKQFRSAELLAMYYLTGLTTNSMYRSYALELVADCAFHQSQYHRAGSFYKQAFEHCSHELSFDNRISYSTNGSYVEVTSSFQAQLKQKESKCLLLSGNVVEASDLLESFIPLRSPFRTYDISMDLGRMYLTTGKKHDAKRCFMDVLDKNIYALEAIELLAQIGGEKSVVSNIIQQKLSQIQSQTEINSSDDPINTKENSQSNSENSGTGMTSTLLHRQSFLLPINDIVNATFYSHRGASYALHAWNYWCKLLDQYPSHTQILLQMATLQSQYPYILHRANCLNTSSTSSLGGKNSIFAKIRSLDLTFMDGMDVYAYSLAKEQNKCELGRLCSDLLEVGDNRHEAWVTLAMYNYTCGDIEKAFAFLEKAITLNPRSKFCHQLMGKLLQSEGRLDHAIVSYFRANEISMDVTCFEGLVEAYLSCSKYKEAICTAKEAINFAPRDPRAMTLVGLALMSAPGSKDRGREKAKKTLQKAFNLDPTNLKSLFALVDLHLEEGEFQTCIDLIKRGIDESDGCGPSFYNVSSIMDSCQNNSLDKLYSKLAEVHIAEKKYGDALECYHKALAINHHSNEARQGMKDLEKVMKYVNAIDESASDEYSYQQDYQHHSYRYDTGV